MIRRNLLLLDPPTSDSQCKTPYSFSLQLALKYLEVGGIKLESTSNQELRLRNTVIKRLKHNSGGYQNADVSGYQILLNYRSAQQVAERVTITDVLRGRVNPKLVKDHIILIGVTATSLKDIFYTPYSSGKSDNSGKMSGVMIHAQSISHILSAVLNQKPLFWFVNEWGEFLWICGCALTGGLIAWRIQHPLWLGLVSGVTLVVLLGANFFVFTQWGWIPIVSPVLGLIFSVGSVVAYMGYQSQQEKEKIAQLVQEKRRSHRPVAGFIREE